VFLAYVYNKDAGLAFVVYKKNRNILSRRVTERTCTIHVNILQTRSG